MSHFSDTIRLELDGAWSSAFRDICSTPLRPMRYACRIDLVHHVDAAPRVFNIHFCAACRDSASSISRFEHRLQPLEPLVHFVRLMTIAVGNRPVADVSI